MKTGDPIVVRGLHKSFGSQKVLDGINLTIRTGETVAVLGRSGAGKSVLLKILIGLQPSDSGSVRIFGREICSVSSKELNSIRRHMGFLFQEAALYDSLTVGENVAFPLRRLSEMTEDQMEQRVGELLAAVGMEDNRHKFPSEVSGGMQKRVGLARALALDPEIVLYDEPTAGLDPITSAEIARLIVDQCSQQRKTGVVVTHDIPATRIFADRIVLLRKGRFIAEGSYESLRDSADPFVRDFLGEAVQQL
jgi:phospholipid/cholesterol/gamma-HCH transport system ATP-binding protein